MSKWFVKGDVDGFFGLWMDNLINLLLIVSFLKGLLGFPDSLIFGRVLPAAALSLLGEIFSIPGRRGVWPRARAATT